MSSDAQALFLFVAFAAFVVAAVLGFIQRAHVAALTAAGLASWVLVPLFIALRAS